VAEVVRSNAALRTHAGPLLLDTHIWLWYLDGAVRQFTAPSLELLRRVNRDRQLLVSDISVWEIGTKVAKGKLQLSVAPEQWIARAERAPGIDFVPLDRQTLLLSSSLPGELHGDPADRMLIASAILRGCPLVTADRNIIDYARKANPLRAVDARR
jgi:PIN domain nuclease of toxin-antitoxin system